MEIFSNWIFWVVMAAVIFVFALIGFLAESKKKKSGNSLDVKNEEKIISSDVKNEAINSNLTSQVEPGATLNLDNGTWNNESNVNSSMADSSSTAEDSAVGVQASDGVSEVSDIVGQAQSNETVIPDISDNLSVSTNSDITNIADSAASEITDTADSAASEITNAADLFNNNDDDDVWNV